MEEMLKIYVPLVQKCEQDNCPKELKRANKKMDANNAPAFDAELYSFGILGVHKITRIIYKMVKDQVEYDDQIEMQKNILNMQKRVSYYEKKVEKVKI